MRHWGDKTTWEKAQEEFSKIRESSEAKDDWMCEEYGQDEIIRSHNPSKEARELNSRKAYLAKLEVCSKCLYRKMGESSQACKSCEDEDLLVNFTKNTFNNRQRKRLAEIVRALNGLFH